MLRYAAKILAKSDIAFFKYHSKSTYNATVNSIKMDSEVLVGQCFPYLSAGDHAGSVRIPVLLTIYGPGRRLRPDQKTRMLFAHSSRGRTWHLTGECVPDPDADPTRYHGLADSDVAIFAMQESEFQPVPKYVTMVLLTKADSGDADLLAAVKCALAGRRMVALSTQNIAELNARCPAGHPMAKMDGNELPGCGV